MNRLENHLLKYYIAILFRATELKRLPAHHRTERIAGRAGAVWPEDRIAAHWVGRCVEWKIDVPDDHQPHVTTLGCLSRRTC